MWTLFRLGKKKNSYVGILIDQKMAVTTLSSKFQNFYMKALPTLPLHEPMFVQLLQGFSHAK